MLVTLTINRLWLITSLEFNNLDSGTLNEEPLIKLIVILIGRN